MASADRPDNDITGIPPDLLTPHLYSAIDRATIDVAPLEPHLKPGHPPASATLRDGFAFFGKPGVWFDLWRAWRAGVLLGERVDWVTESVLEPWP